MHDLLTSKLYYVSLCPRPEHEGFTEAQPVMFGPGYPTIYVRARSFTEAIERAEQANPKHYVYGINIVNSNKEHKNLL